MGTRGPAPKPLSILGESSHHAKYRRGDDAQHEAKAPACPSWLSDEGKREWRRVVRLMSAARTLTELDRGILAGYCELWAEVERLTRALDGLAPTDPAFVPLSRRRGQAMDRLQRFGMQLGLTPASRGRVHPIRPPEGKSRVMSRQRGG
jgi:P27 family predicted phage terminase small subunit